MKPKKDRPDRQLYEFWLDNAKERVQPIIFEFDKLKRRRRLTGRLVDMALLWFDLAAGRTEKLTEYFPAFANRFTTTDGDKLLQSIFDQQAIILKKLEAGATVQPIQQTGKSLTNTTIAMPTFDDDDTIVITANPNAGAESASNFMDAVIGIQVVDTPQ